MSVLSKCMSVDHMHGCLVPREARRGQVINPLELEQMVVSHPEDAENHTKILWNTSMSP